MYNIIVRAPVVFFFTDEDYFLEWILNTFIHLSYVITEYFSGGVTGPQGQRERHSLSLTRTTALCIEIQWRKDLKQYETLPGSVCVGGDCNLCITGREFYVGK